MGAEIIRLGNIDEPMGSHLTLGDLADLSFQRFDAPNNSMSIWLMRLARDKKIFPWWSYQGVMDEDIEKLYGSWSVSSPQHLFDLLFLNQIFLFGGSHFFVIFPGNTKTTGWGQLREEDRTTFLKGQGCNYYLDGLFKGKMVINWVPFYQPQSLVRNPRFDSFWRLFLSKVEEQDEANSICFFSMKNMQNLPEVIRLLIHKEEKRSEKLLEYVEWYGLFCSPKRPNVTTSCVIYTKNKDYLQQLTYLERQTLNQFEKIKQELLKDSTPGTTLKIINRHIAL